MNLIYYSVHESIIKYLNVFDLNAEVIEFPSELNQLIEEFKDMNPELTHSSLLNFSDLFIIEFTRKIH